MPDDTHMSPTPLSLLIVEDEPDLRALLRAAFTQDGHRVSAAADGDAAAAAIAGAVFDLVLADVLLPHVDGLTLFRRIRREAPDTDVILMTAHGNVGDAVAALKEGATDYLIKPFDVGEMRVRVGRLAEQRALRRELDDARQRLAAQDGPAIVGDSPSLARLVSQLDTLAQSDAPVLINGESGTGKELIARTLHQRSPRRGKPFVAVNCAAFPETLIEAELFGHERGAFTGAVKRRDGRFKAADGGTLLLDEIAELPLPSQAKLLRVLQEGTVEPLGTNEAVRVDVRVISATHRNLRQRIADGLFREDLYYRLRVLDIDIPPLRDRRGDLPLLLSHFLHRLTPSPQKPPAIAPRALAALSQYPFPGNVRELAHAVERALVLSRGGEIDLEHLPVEIAGAQAAGGEPVTAPALRPLSVAIKEFEREYLARALTQAGGKRVRAAEMLGISRKSLWEKMRLYGIEAERPDDD